MEVPHWWLHAALPQASAADGHEVFRHLGMLDHLGLQGLVQRAETWSLQAADSVITRKRLLNVVVEALENLRVHPSPAHAPTVFAMLHAAPGAYCLRTGSAMPSATAEALLHRIEVLNAMHEADLKDHFLRLLGHDGRTERGGAGLGLVTLARKAQRPLEPITLPRDPGSRYLVLKLRVLRQA